MSLFFYGVLTVRLLDLLKYIIKIDFICFSVLFYIGCLKCWDTGNLKSHVWPTFMSYIFFGQYCSKMSIMLSFLKFFLRFREGISM